LRDQIFELRQMLAAQDPRPEWEKIREAKPKEKARKK